VKNIKNKAVKINVDVRILLNIGNKSFLGQDKIELIEKIKEYGTLCKAVGAMKISYRHAQKCISEFNYLAGKPLVILRRGGKYGGSAEITEAGEKAILIFKQLRKEVAKLLEIKTNSIEL